MTFTAFRVYEFYLATDRVAQCDDAIKQYADAGISGTVHDLEHRKMRDDALKIVQEIFEELKDG